MIHLASSPGQIGFLIKSLRQDAGMTQAELARECRTVQSAISDIELGVQARWRTYEKVFRALGYDIDLSVTRR